MLEQRLPAEDREHPGEQRRADEQPAHHGGGLGGQEHRLLGALPVERAGLHRQQKGAGGADAGGFGRGRDSEQDNAEHDDR